MTFCNPYLIILYTKYSFLQNVHPSMICSNSSIFGCFAANNPYLYDLQQTIKFCMICQQIINLNMLFCNPFFIVFYTKYGLLQNIHLSMICSKPSILVGLAANHPFLYDLQQTIKFGMICCKPCMICSNSSIFGCFAANNPYLYDLQQTIKFCMICQQIILSCMICNNPSNLV
jgi:hypothetical protein